MDAPHFPRQVLIDAHGGGGFRFADMSHRGSLLCLPDGVWAWPIMTPEAATVSGPLRIPDTQFITPVTVLVPAKVAPFSVKFVIAPP